MKSCKYCDAELTDGHHVYLGYHPDCYQKNNRRPPKLEDLGRCVYCLNTLNTPKEKSSGYHIICSNHAANGYKFKDQKITPKQYRDLLKSTQIKPPLNPPIETSEFLSSIQNASRHFAKEAAIGSVVKSKQAIDGVKDIFKIADARLGKTLDITNEEEAYAWAASEIENDEMVKGIWAMAFADAEGDEKKQKALYIKYRAKKLLDELHRMNLDK
jgi:hypothetical protein